MKEILDAALPSIVHELNSRVTAGKFKIDKKKLFWICEIEESDDPEGDQDAMWSMYCDVSEDLRSYKMYLSPEGHQSYKVEFDALNSWQDNDSCGFDVKVEITAVAITHAAVSAAMEMTSKDVRAPKAVRDGLVSAFVSAFDMKQPCQSINWDELAVKLYDAYGETLDEGLEDLPSNYWLSDVTVGEIIEFFKNNIK